MVQSSISAEKCEVLGHGKHTMKYRVKRQDDHGNVCTVPHEGVWYETREEASAVTQALEEHPHKQMYWIEDEEGRRC
jgi:hypothetical protein